MRVKSLPMLYVTFSNIVCVLGYQSPYILVSPSHVEQAAKDLDLVFGDQLREGDEEADLKGRQAVVRPTLSASSATRARTSS
jgi:hypothetical protein